MGKKLDRKRKKDWQRKIGKRNREQKRSKEEFNRWAGSLEKTTRIFRRFPK